MHRIDCKGKTVLVIPDTHAPFEHPDAIKFLQAVKQKYLDEDSIITHLGDEIDSHCISFHDSDPDIGLSPSSELEKAIESMHLLQELFPNIKLCTSNHGSLFFRRQKSAGLPIHIIKSYQDILGTPLWEWFDEILLETKMGDIYLCHGKTSAPGKLMKEQGTYGAIQGHFHGRYQINWYASSIRERFDAFSGCLIDQKSLAFSYGKNHLPKPILGCMLITKMGYPKLIPMITNDEGRWIWELA